MGIFGGLSARAFGGKPPKIPAGASVQLETVLSSGITGAGMDGGTFSQRPYWVMLDADHQEVGDRHYLKPTIEAFTNLAYAGAWCAWVQAQGSVPMPAYPDGPV